VASKKFSVLALFAGLVFVLSSSIHDAHATTFTATQNGEWVDTATWGGSAPPITINSGDTVSIPAGVAVTITARVTISNSGTINNAGIITNIEGAITSDGTINNSGTINNNFFGTFIPNAGDTITNSGTINNSGGTINNNRSGIMTNSGTITNSGGTINNYIGNIYNTGTISNNSGTVNNFGYLSNIGTITNSDIINNAGTILSPCNYIGNGGIITNNSGATINNTGTIASYETINNSGTINNNVEGIITNYFGGVITNSGTINNAGGTINNTLSGTITNSGTITITKSGIINNLGSIINSNTISNSSGKINNSGYFSNTGTVTNSDTINNTGYIGNGGIITNNSGATINNSGTISSYGTITNSGTIINYSGGTINKVTGGPISNNPSPFNFTVGITNSNQCGDGPRSHPGDDPPPSRIKPSFGGVGNMVFADGLTLDGKVYNLGNFAVNIPKNIANVGQPITIKIKEQLGFGPQDWKYIAVYMNFEGKSPETYNAHLILSNDKNDGPKLVDPKGYVNDFKVTTVLDSQYVYTTFSFTAARAMPDTSMIVTAWDGHNRVNNVYVGGAIQFGNDPIVKPYHAPDWLHEYTSFQDASLAVENEGYQKPLIFGHISNSEQVWKGSDGGSLKWLFDDANKTVSLVIYDNNGITVFKKTESLKKVDGIYSKCTDRKDCMYSWSAHGQLSRTDSGKLEKAKKDEQDRVSATLRSIGYTKHYDQTQMR